MHSPLFMDKSEGVFERLKGGLQQRHYISIQQGGHQWMWGQYKDYCWGWRSPSSVSPHYASCLSKKQSSSQSHQATAPRWAQGSAKTEVMLSISSKMYFLIWIHFVLMSFSEFRNKQLRARPTVDCIILPYCTHYTNEWSEIIVVVL